MVHAGPWWANRSVAPYAKTYIAALYAIEYRCSLDAIAYKRQGVSAMSGIPEIRVRTEVDLGNAVRRIRKLKGLTQADVGDRVRLRQGTVSSIESGNPNTRLDTLIAVLQALDLEIIIRSRKSFAQESVAGDDPEW